MFRVPACHAASVNTASQNLPHHLAILRERMLHPTDYEKAMHYFLEEFVGDVAFLRASLAEDAPHLLALVTHVACQALGHKVSVDEARISRLPGHNFFHGGLAMDGRAVLFFYFTELETGVLTIMPGVRGAAEMARFQMPGGLIDPRKN